MSYTINAVLRTEKKDKKGLCPVAICVTVNRARAYKHTNLKLTPEQWSNGKVNPSVPNYVLLNARLKKQISDIEALLLEMELNGEEVTHLRAKAALAGKTETQSFFEQSKAMLAEVKTQLSAGTYRRYVIEQKILQEYAPGLTFSDITPVFLTKYHKYLLAKGKDNNTTINAFKYIRRVFNYARSIGITELYPFDKYKVPVYKEKGRHYLTKTDLTKIQELLDKPLQETLRTVIAFFLLECYSAIRHSDWKTFSVEKALDNENLILRTNKTGTRVTIPVDVYPSLKWVLDYIKDNNLKFTLSLEKTNVYLKSVAAMAGFEKNLTTHIGRHTFAVLMHEKGFSKELIAELMGVTTKVVSTYAKYSSSKARTEFERLGGI